MERDKYYEVRNRDNWEDMDKQFCPNVHTVITFGYLGNSVKRRLSVDVVIVVNTPHTGHYYPKVEFHPRIDGIQFISAYAPVIEQFYSDDADVTPDDVIVILERNGFKPMDSYRMKTS